MRKNIALLLAGLTSFSAVAQQYEVASREIVNGHVVKKIWLQQHVLPEVHILNPVYTPVASLPAKTQAGQSGSFKIVPGQERKKPFILLDLPAYIMDNGQPKQLTGFYADIKEAPVPAQSNHHAQAKTTGTNSVLANGTWYKIAITDRGVYKIDYNFVRDQLGIKSNITSANIRLFGNGGTMVPEDNAAFRYDDLKENAIKVVDGGDGSFGPGDYILFYANGPMEWEKDSLRQRFIHHKNIYSNQSFYFLNVDQGAGTRIANQGSVNTPNVTVTTYNDYAVHEEDLANVGHIGKEWVGEEFSTLPGKQNTRSFSFNFPNLADSVHLNMYTVSASTAPLNQWNINYNGITLDAFSDGNTDEFNVAIPKYKEYHLPGSVSTTPILFGISFTPGVSDGRGYLNYLEVNTRRSFAYSGGQLAFRDWRSVGAGKIAQFNVGGNPEVWDVTDAVAPVIMNVSGGSFKQNANVLHEYIAFDGSFPTPSFVSAVNNQNLHALPQTDYIIVTNPKFRTAADKLADFHRQNSNLRVTVAETPQIFNEFGSGSQDIGAIRDFVKMFYDRAGTNQAEMPRYLLLFGDASYDYKDRITANSNYVPTYESDNAFYVDYVYCNDDFFGFLDDNENIASSVIANTLDIGIGRLPVQTPEDANTVVDKLIHYKSSSALGPWRLANTYIGDNEDGAGQHLKDAEFMNATVDSINKVYNDTKVYLDNYTFISTPGGARCPDANKTINDQIFKGTFMVNYSGHGSTVTLAHERILTADDFNGWKNYDKLPFMITATCDFSQFDNPELQSAGEKLIMKGNGGAIAMLTTTQAVYAHFNKMINSQYLEAQFDQRPDGSWNTFGDAFTIGKNITYATTTDVNTLANFRKFTLLGDPAMTPNFPKYFVKTVSIKEIGATTPADSLKALGGYTVDAKVTDNSNSLLTNFNGTAYITIYDKPRNVTLITKEVPHESRTYSVQNNIIYKGKATVKNGLFSFSFVVPKDINYDFGEGKISYYAENGVYDAAGMDSGIIVGGASDHPIAEDDGPKVMPYMNDSFFVDGGITGTNSLLFVKLFDETGINVSGNNVGHDLTAVLDGDVKNPYTLNDYYETAPNDYTRGYVSFPVVGLPDGKHSFTVKAWDVNNNSAEGTVNFVVYNGKVMAVDKLYNYPNPFSDRTHFVFEHNHPNETLNVKIRIYNTTGMLIRTLDQTFVPEGSNSHEIIWDGTSDSGAKLPDGVYVYRLNLSTEGGAEATAYQKLVLVR